MSEQQTQLTVHGARRFDENGELAGQKSKDSTWQGIDYLLNQIERRNIPLQLNIELSGPESPTYLTTRNEVTETINKFENSLNICWDLTHDYSYQPLVEPPSPEFLSAVGHVHIHGIDNLQQKHRCLSQSTLDFEPIVNILKDFYYSNAIVLEVLMHTFNQYDDYLKNLGKDLALLSNLIK